jgi:NAD(P)-dependent dehydrogenase (short-subunit alcohol dehydrogenase family)
MTTSVSEETESPVAIITASGGMMGSAIADALGVTGHRLVINDRVDARRVAAAEAMNRAGYDVVSVTADVSTRAGAEELVGTALARWGRLDVLVNVAGGIKGPIMNPIWDITEEQWDVTVRTNLTSAFHMTQISLRTMMSQNSGHIVNIASTSWAGSPAHSHYAAAKAGLISFTRSVATQVGPYGIRANVIAPGGTMTLAAQRPDGQSILGQADWANMYPLGRPNQPEDIANAVQFLVSERARNISGQILTIAGGLNPSL